MTNRPTRKFTKAENKMLRTLLGIASERALESALETLEADFKAWRGGRVTAFELNESIHKFHNGTSRKLYRIYGDTSLAELTVGHAIKVGLIAPGEVDDELRELLLEGTSALLDD